MTTAIDLFAGWGGFSLGAEQAGAHVAWAGNHWPLAVEAHAANHPQAHHVCQDLRQADWTQLPAYELLLAAPACQGHSQASQPKRRLYHDALRATAWSVVDCADVTEPAAICVENVPDFLRWRLYPAWRGSLEALGYRVQELRLVASEHGAPQRRERLFVVATKRAIAPIVLPREQELPFGPCVETDAGGWRPVATSTPRVRERVERGRRNHGRRFLTQHVTGHPGVSLDEPIRTITTKDQWALVDGDEYRPLTVRETARAMGFPDSYRWPKSGRREQITGLGNAVCVPVARKLVAHVCDAAL
jgi:DNA (cytosine-5)-methyltransferase 1